MTEPLSSRKVAWKPAARPGWVNKLNREGDCMDIKSVVPLDENSLVSTARHNTGLSDFGDDDWYEPFKMLIHCLDDEARLNLMGRLMTRSELLIYLEARLRVEDTLKRHPEILEQQIQKPIFVVGQGRSGTTFMQNVLSRPPENGTTRTWEAMFPCPPPEAESYGTDQRIAQANALCGQLNRVVPELAPMYEYMGDKSTEIVQLFCLTFNSPNWFPIFGGQVQRYMEYVNTLDVTPVYQYLARVLKLLQWKNPRKYWILKSPAALLHMPQILKVFPDAGFVWNHRDPIKALSSAVNLAGTLFWSRSDFPFCDGTMDMFTSADLSAFLLTQPIQWLEDGTVPKERLCNIQFLEFVKNPRATIAHIHDYFGMVYSETGKAAVENYLRENPRSARPAHDYSTGTAEQIAREREVYAPYQDYFFVASEV